MKASLYYYTIWELVKHHSTAASLTWHVQGLWFRRRSKKTSKLRVTGLCAGNSPATGQLPAQMASYVKNVSIWWRHHVICVSKTDPCIMWRKRNLTWFLSEFLWLMKNLEHFCIRQHSKWPTRSREISRHLEDWTSRKKIELFCEFCINPARQCYGTPWVIRKQFCPDEYSASFVPKRKLIYLRICRATASAGWLPLKSTSIPQGQ